MGLKLSDLLPCASFFAAGRTGRGIVTLLMQLSLIFWPVAASWARELSGRAEVNRMLAQFAETHRVDPYAQPVKKFRRAA
jgi:hypothetical protein